MRSKVLLFVLGAGALLAACSSSSPAAAPPTTGGTTSTPAAAQTTTTSGSSSSSDVTWSPAGTFGTEPTVVVPSGSPPSQLLSHDLIVGTGATATDGSKVTVQYVGYSWTTKKKFDASWDRNQPFVFTLGAGQVIPGWDQGVAGMKVGGRRELIIPPALAYGSQSPSPEIASNDTLIFVIDLLNVS